MKIDSFSNLLDMQQKMGKAISVGNTPDLAMIAKSAIAQKNTFKGFLPIGFPLNQFQMKGDLARVLQSISKRSVANPTVNLKSIDVISKMFAEQSKMASAFQKMVGDNSLSHYLKNIQAQNAVISQLFRPIGLRGINFADPYFLEKLGKTTEKASTITIEVTEKKYVTVADLHELEIFVSNSFKELKDEIQRSGKTPMVIINFWVGIVGLLLALFTIVQPLVGNSKDDEQPVTKGQLDELKKRWKKKLNDTIQEVTKSLTVRVKCSLRLKPKWKSLFILTLNSGDIISVIGANHKWAYVSVIDNRDNRIVTGWVLKKYLK